MSGLVFLTEVAIFVLIAYWAFRGDTKGLTDASEGLFAMKDLAAEEQRRGPRYRVALQSRGAAASAPPRFASKPELEKKASPAPAQPWKDAPRLGWRRGR